MRVVDRESLFVTALFYNRETVEATQNVEHGSGYIVCYMHIMGYFRH